MAAALTTTKICERRGGRSPATNQGLGLISRRPLTQPTTKRCFGIPRNLCSASRLVMKRGGVPCLKLKLLGGMFGSRAR